MVDAVWVVVRRAVARVAVPVDLAGTVRAAVPAVAVAVASADVTEAVGPGVTAVAIARRAEAAPATRWSPS